MNNIKFIFFLYIYYTLYITSYYIMNEMEFTIFRIIFYFYEYLINDTSGNEPSGFHQWRQQKV